MHIRNVLDKPLNSQTLKLTAIDIYLRKKVLSVHLIKKNKTYILKMYK